MDREEIFTKIRAIGSAALTLDIENSHSGNISYKCTDERGNELLAITASGSQKGELTREKICFPALNKINYGYYKSSSETDIHAKILRIPGVNATVHGHTKMATVVTLDDAPTPKENPRAPLIPVDPHGIKHLKEVCVDWFAVASGSKEMTDTLAMRLVDHKASYVQAHGAFGRGATVEEAFFNLCLVEHAGEVIYYCDLMGVDREAARQAAAKATPLILERMPDYSNELDKRVDFADEPDTVDMFKSTGFRIFESRYTPFHTGSMSIRAANTLLYLPKAAQPHDLTGPMLELPLKENDPGDYELSMHRAVYNNTPLKSVFHAYPSETEALTMKMFLDGLSEKPRAIPIDAEGGFLYPAIPILPQDHTPDDLCRALLDYRVVIVMFGGVWAAGEQAVGEAMRHISSCKDVCFYRTMAIMKGMDLAAMEPERARNW